MTIDEIRAFAESFFATEAGQLAILVLALPILDWITGVLAALRDGTFALDAVASVLGKHATRVAAIWVLLIGGWLLEDITVPGLEEVPLLSAVAIAGAIAYIAETIGSIARSWGPKSGLAQLTRDPEQPVPKS